MSGIPYCDEVWEVTGGCTKCSPGCLNCWAVKEVWRLAHNPLQGDKWKGLVEKKDGVLSWTGKIECFNDALEIPLRRKKPTRYFVDSKADLFHEKVSIGFLTHVFDTIEQCPQHTFLILTKRPKQALKMMWGKHGEGWKYFGKGDYHPNVHFGVSISTLDEMWKVTELSRIPAAVRWVSFEPLLADVGVILLTSCREDDTDLEEFGQHIDGVIVGGESGPGARPMCPDWVRSIRDQCVAAGVPFYFKQWGEWLPVHQRTKEQFEINTCNFWPKRVTDIEGERFFRFTKKKAGHLLDGKEWKQLPERR